MQTGIQVQLHTSELECYFCALSLFELSQVLNSVTEVQEVVTELYSALLKPPEETPQPQIHIHESRVMTRFVLLCYSFFSICRSRCIQGEISRRA